MKKLIVVSLFLVLSGCSSLNHLIPPEQAGAIKIVNSAAFDELTNLPKPKGRIPVSVYSFRDQTGQYKPQANVSSFSTAVTQGATSILMQALSDSDWFLPVEREGLQNILTERKIIRASLQNDKKEGQEVKDLPPLTTSKLLIEGGIISYDSNIKTGGFGAEYFGIGASELYREDLISVYMRAIDVRTGQVLVSVSTSKKILSKLMSGPAFLIARAIGEGSSGRLRISMLIATFEYFCFKLSINDCHNNTGRLSTHRRLGDGVHCGSVSCIQCIGRYVAKWFCN